MAWLREIKYLKNYVGRMERGEDLLGALESFARSNKIRLAKIEAIGALEKACVAYHDQNTLEFNVVELDGPLEILNLTGNLSLGENKPVFHGKITVADTQGRAFGGHLLMGSIVFACEFFIHEYSGTELHRNYDEASGLSLWMAPPVK
ncbi:MAG: DNA-binding protein [Spirochaetales bacterium]|nr:DNA-binding protein [Spirochaetales bacterium]